jgi:uncharacterized membrane protein
VATAKAEASKQQQRAAKASARHARRRQQQHQQHERQLQQQQFVPLLRHFVCVASYGFLGDVMEASEKLRWMGPLRCVAAAVAVSQAAAEHTAAMAIQLHRVAPVCWACCHLCCSVLPQHQYVLHDLHLSAGMMLLAHCGSSC